MHEIGIVRDIISAVEAECGKRNVTHVLSFTVQVARHSGFHADHIQNCFQLIQSEKPFFKETKMNIEQVDVYAQCTGCKNRFVADDEIASCPSCGSVGKIERVDPLVLKEIQTEVEDNPIP